MDLSFVIPAHNEERHIGNCLQSILDETKDAPCSVEIIVVNNASTDATAAVAKRYRGVKVVGEPKKGLTRARQAGYLNSKGTLVANIDADTALPRGWLARALKEFSSDPKLVCLSGPFRYHDLSGLRKFAAEAVWWISAPFAYLIAGYMILGANFVARRSALDAIGGFDVNISFYGEDTDLAKRLSKFGKVKFSMGFFIYGSGRRIMEEGFWKTELRYGVNFVWEALTGKPFTKEYRDIR